MNLNTVALTGNLTKDPELRSTDGGTSIAKMRIAVNSRKKDQSGEWTDVANYFNVVAFGKQAENCAEYLSKGRPIAVQGRLEWREWETDDGQRREQVSVVADAIQFLAAKSDTPNQEKTEDAIPF